MGYIVFAFSSMPHPFRYAMAAIIALLHDVAIVVGAFSLFGKVFGIEINLMFVTGLLTVIGFSVHDTIVIFDRVRENVQRAPTARLGENVNAALVQNARTLAEHLDHAAVHDPGAALAGRVDDPELPAGAARRRDRRGLLQHRDRRAGAGRLG